MPENILILAGWRLAGLVDDPCRRDTPTAMMTRMTTRTTTTMRTIRRRSSGNPNPTNSPHPPYGRLGTEKRGQSDPTSLRTFWRQDGLQRWQKKN